MGTPSILPFDAPNRQQTAQGHPPDWRPPRPKDGYDLVVLGGGPAGLTAAVTAAQAGHAVAMVERNLTGGTASTSAARRASRCSGPRGRCTKPGTGKSLATRSRPTPRWTSRPS
jgi:cation diffusion facilitator CzcD-associated flavoprotein CzcO